MTSELALLAASVVLGIVYVASLAFTQVSIERIV
jgi:hypothetical protein